MLSIKFLIRREKASEGNIGHGAHLFPIVHLDLPIEGSIADGRQGPSPVELQGL